MECDDGFTGCECDDGCDCDNAALAVETDSECVCGPECECEEEGEGEGVGGDTAEGDVSSKIMMMVSNALGGSNHGHLYYYIFFLR